MIYLDDVRFIKKVFIIHNYYVISTFSSLVLV